MLLAIDIGNTNITMGCIRNDEILFTARIATDRNRTSDQYGVEIKNMLEVFGVRTDDISDCIISSVVILGLSITAQQASIHSPKLCVGMFVARPTAIPVAPFTSKFGYLPGNVFGSSRVSS